MARLLEHPACQGAGTIQLVGVATFWDEAALPFRIAGGGTVLHVIPDPAFRKEHLAGSVDERLLIVDCPDDEGWLAPEDVVRDWLDLHVKCAPLDDLLLSHPLYEYLTRTDDAGHSRGGRGPLAHWMPGFPNLASLQAPEFLPGDGEAPRVNRDRHAYATAVQDLLGTLQGAFDLAEIEVGLRFGDDPAAW